MRASRYDDNGAMLGIRGTARDITEQHLATLQIEHLALHDSLTGPAQPASACSASSRRHCSRAGVGALLFLDIDHFKYVNDNFGHRAGDQLIVGVGGVLRDLARSINGELFRLGGDEFAIHLPDGAAQGRDRGRRERARRRAPLPLPGGRQQGGLQPDGLDRHRALSVPRRRRAGAAVERRHRDVPGQGPRPQPPRAVRPGSESLRSTHKRVHWAKKLRDALDEDRLVLYRQPVVRLTDRKPVHHEILVRIRDDNGGSSCPASSSSWPSRWA